MKGIKRDRFYLASDGLATKIIRQSEKATPEYGKKEVKLALELLGSWYFKVYKHDAHPMLPWISAICKRVMELDKFSIKEVC